MPLSSDLQKEPDGKEAALWMAFRSHGSTAAREQLFTHHAAFARNIARRHFRERSRGDIDLHDFYQLAYTGLLESLDRFDPRRGTPFRPFAAHRISGSISDGILRMSEVREQMSWRQRLYRERMQSAGETGTVQEPIEKLTEIVVGLALGFMLEGTGLFVPDENGRTDVHPNAKTAYDSLAWKEMITQLKTELQRLPEREQAILQKHYIDGVGFDGLSSLLGISKGRVSQIHRAALVVLRKRMIDRGHFRIGNIAK
jgi:RNA polymerase sigma factor FliA